MHTVHCLTLQYLEIEVVMLKEVGLWAASHLHQPVRIRCRCFGSSYYRGVCIKSSYTVIKNDKIEVVNTIVADLNFEISGLYLIEYDLKNFPVKRICFTTTNNFL